MSDPKDDINREMSEAIQAGMGPKIARFALVCLGGIPGIGGVFGAGAGAWSEAEQAPNK